MFCNKDGNFSWCRRSFSRLLWSVQVTALAAALKVHPLFRNLKRPHWVFGSRRLDTTILTETSGIKYPVTQRDVPEQQIPLLECFILKVKAQRSFDRSVSIYQSTWRNNPELNFQQHRCENLKWLTFEQVFYLPFALQTQFFYRCACTRSAVYCPLANLPRAFHFLVFEEKPHNWIS